MIKKSNLQRNIRIYYVYLFLTQAMFMSAVLIPFFKEWGGLNQTQIQTLQSFFWIFVLFLEIPTGVIADRFGRKSSLILGALVWAIGIVIYTSTQSFAVFVLAEFTFAIGASLMSGANQALAYDSLVALDKEEEAKSIFARSEAIKMLGIFAGGAIGTILAYFVGPREIFFLSLIPQLMAFAIAFAFTEPLQKTKTEASKWIDTFKNGIGTILNSKLLRILSMDLILVSSIAYFVVWLYQAKLYFLESPLVMFGIFSAILPLSEAIIIFNHKFWEKLFGGERNYLRFVAIIMALGFILAGIINHWIAVLIFVVLAGGFGLTRRSIYIAIMNKEIKSENRSTSISTINMLRGLFIAIINPVIGFSADKNLNLTLIFLGLAAVFAFFVSSKATKYLE